MLRSVRFLGLVAALVLVVGSLKLSRDSPRLCGTRFGSLDSCPAVVEHNWSFNATRDRHNHSLLDAQCQTAFPDLYLEINRAAAFWNKSLDGGRIERENINLTWSYDGGLHVMIYDQQMYIIYSRGLNHFKPWRDRSLGTLHQIHRAILASREPVPNIEFTIKINDKIDLTEETPNSTVWAFSRDVTNPAMDQVWVIPDFNFWNYRGVAGSYSAFQREALQVDTQVAKKKPSLVWRGTTAFNPKIREKLLEQTKDRPWSDVEKVDEGTHNEEQTKHKLSIVDHCQYMFAVHTEGTTWSGRLKYLLSCRAVAVIHNLTWTTHLYHLLRSSGPLQNYLAVKRDWSDLEGKIEHLLENVSEAQRIADNAAATFRDQYVTPAAQTCYWRRLFKTWSQVAFEPTPYETIDGQQRWRGMPYEEYIFWEEDVIPASMKREEDDVPASTKITDEKQG